MIRYKGYAFITIFGLSTGISVSLFIFLWVMDELSYDRFHKNADRIYRVMGNFTYSDGTIETGWGTPMKLGEALQTGIPEIEHTMRISWDQGLLLRFEEKAFYESGFYADSSLFSMFTFPLIEGDAKNPLPDNNSVAISEKLSRKYFGNEPGLGKIFRISQNKDLKVTAIFSDIPENSSLKFDFILPYSLWMKEHAAQDGWGNNNMQTFVSLKPGTSLEQANDKIKGIIKKNCSDCINEPFLFPYADLRLYSDFQNGKSSGGKIDYVMSFSLVAAIILCIACINFMNLATARSATRSREVGIRKVIGAQRSGLIIQFIGESLLLTFFALFIALAVVQVVLPFFNALVNKTIHLDFGNPLFLGGLIAILLFCGITAGAYPAFFLSSFKPTSVLKGGQAQSVLSGGKLRRILVITQFAVSAILISGSLVVYNQITYIRNKHLGFDKENIILLDQFGGALKNQEVYKNELLAHPQIKSVGLSGQNPFDVRNSTTDPIWAGKPEGANISFKVITCDQGYLPTLGIKVLQGRNFSDNYKQDSVNYLINEKAMHIMGLTTEDVIGSDLDMWNGKGKIIGLVKDFNNGNLRKEIEPLIFIYNPANTWRIFAKIEGDPASALAHAKIVQEKYDPGYPFEYDILDDKFNQQYRSEAMVGKLSSSFTVVAILISCLGLFGLAAFTAERRMKELGIRKVLGASAFGILRLLCSDFGKLVLAGLVIGSPISWYLASKYLSTYAFHTELSTGVFVAASACILLIALLTVVYQSTKAALANPVDSLRNE